MSPRDLILQVAVFALAISVHESAHAYVANMFGDPTAKRQGRISLNPMDHVDMFGTILFPLILILAGAPVFGWARPVPVNPRNLRNPRRDRSLVSAAGPASNLALALCSIFLLVMFYPLLNDAVFALGDGARKLLYWNTLINTLLCVFNMIPVPPLDGGGVLEYFVSRETARWMQQNQMLLIGGLFILMFTGVLNGILSFFVRTVQLFQFSLISFLWG